MMATAANHASGVSSVDPFVSPDGLGRAEGLDRPFFYRERNEARPARRTQEPPRPLRTGRFAVGKSGGSLGRRYANVNQRMRTGAGRVRRPASPVVFYSMATSSAEDVPRSLQFLFSRKRLNVAVFARDVPGDRRGEPVAAGIARADDRADAADQRALPLRGSVRICRLSPRGRSGTVARLTRVTSASRL